MSVFFCWWSVFLCWWSVFFLLLVVSIPLLVISIPLLMVSISLLVVSIPLLVITVCIWFLTLAIYHVITVCMVLIPQGNFSADLLRNFTRRGAPSPGGGTKMTPPSRSHAISLQDSFSSGKGTSLVFSDTSEQAIFKLADSFSKQFFR